MSNSRFDVVVGDLQIPFHDVPLCNAFLDWVKAERRNINSIVINGDLCDMYQISKFAKDPSRRFTLRNDIELTSEWLGCLRKAYGGEIGWIGGNHEHRLEWFKWDRVPEFHDFDCLSMESLFGLKKLKIGYQDAFTEIDVNGILVMHGNLARTYSGYSAKGMMDKWCCSGLMNHTHRFGCHMRTYPGHRVMRWYENGCMCRLDPEYIIGTPDWQQGWGVIPANGAGVEWVMADEVKKKEGYEKTLTWRGQRWGI